MINSAILHLTNYLNQYLKRTFDLNEDIVALSNIVEGRQRQHSKEFLQHFSIACGSLAEVETHIQIAGRLDYIDEDQINKVLDKTAELGRMLNGLRRSIEKKANP